MDKIRISAVKYANTYPFIYGLEQSGFSQKAIIETDHPADCAAKLISGRADLGLVPVASLPLIRDYRIASDFCIGANGNVRTVMLLSNQPFDEIKTVYLDYRSVSSVNLVKVLARYSWKKDFKWIDTSRGFGFTDIKATEAVVLIGDQCFEYEKRFRYAVDLAYEWKSYSGLPFVFACWVSNRKLDEGFSAEFNMALGSGVNDIEGVIRKYGNSGAIKGDDLRNYLTMNIDYSFNDEKKKALSLFLELMEKLNQVKTFA